MSEQVRTAERVEVEQPKFDGLSVLLRHENQAGWVFNGRISGNEDMLRYSGKLFRIFRLPADDEPSPPCEDKAVRAHGDHAGMRKLMEDTLAPCGVEPSDTPRPPMPETLRDMISPDIRNALTVYRDRWSYLHGVGLIERLDRIMAELGMEVPDDG